MYGFHKILLCINRVMGFLGGPVVKSLPGNAGDVGLILHVVEELSLCTTIEPAPLSQGSATREATAMRSPHPRAREQPPLATTREEPEQQRRPSTAKRK